MHLRINFRLVCSAAVLLIGVGCSGGSGHDVPEGTIVSGRILQDGEPLKMDRPEVALGRVEVQFYPTIDVNDSGMEATEVDTEGNFQLLGPGRGIPPGKYKVAIFHDQTGYGEDVLQGAFSEENTPIEITIPEQSVGSVFKLGDIELSDYDTSAKSEAN